MGDRRSLFREVNGTTVLLRMALLLEARGWTQHLTEDALGRLDILGALVYVMSGDVTDADSPIETLVASVPEIKLGRALLIWDVLCDALPPDPPSWNDADGRTGPDVIAALRVLALELEQIPVAV